MDEDKQKKVDRLFDEFFRVFDQRTEEYQKYLDNVKAKLQKSLKDDDEFLAKSDRLVLEHRKHIASAKL